MKLILRQYLADLRERDELDAVLPDLVSELGFNVLSRPSRGTRQNGVDVAAIGPDNSDGGRHKVFLFTIKAGDLRRREWDDGSPQAVRQSLNEIVDSYIPTRIPDQYEDLDIVICLCIGGEMKEDVQVQWTGFVQNNRTEKIRFRVWNGDKLAELLLSGVLRQELLEPRFQTHFRKSVAMVDHPEVAYRFFALLTQGLLDGNVDDRNRVTRLRQVYICLWVFFVWARDAGNLDAPLRASEYALLYIWNDCRLVDGEKSKEMEAHWTVLKQTLKLHLLIADLLLVKKLRVYADKPLALSMAVESRSSVDVNLALFDLFGRVSLFGLWQHWHFCHETDEESSGIFEEKRNQALRTAIEMINANPTLRSPMRDDFAIEVALFMILAQICDSVSAVSGYLEDMACRVEFSIQRRGAYPVPMTSYHDLAGHPTDRSDEYLVEHTKGSVLYPLLIAWLDRLILSDTRSRLVACIERELPHTTQQVWVPDGDTDGKFWTGRVDHGAAIVDLPLSSGPAKYSALLDRIKSDHAVFNDLSTTRYGLWPIFLVACRHFRMPVPPHLWFLESNSHMGVR